MKSEKEDRQQGEVDHATLADETPQLGGSRVSLGVFMCSW